MITNEDAMIWSNFIGKSNVLCEGQHDFTASFNCLENHISNPRKK